MSLDQYRILYFEAIDEWERDKDFLQRHSKYTMSTADQQYLLLNICPGDLRKEIMKDFDFARFPTYLSLKQHVLNLSTRDRDLQAQPKGVHEVANRDKKTKKGDDCWPEDPAWPGDEDYPVPEKPEYEDPNGDWTYIGALKGG